jgi:hypothetical protein
MEKVIVEVIAKTRKDGVIIPGIIIWDDGHEYKIDRIIDACRAQALNLKVKDGDGQWVGGQEVGADQSEGTAEQRGESFCHTY